MGWKRDFHYSTALAMMGDALCMREAYVQGADYYMQAMQEMEKHVGKSNAYLESKSVISRRNIMPRK